MELRALALQALCTPEPAAKAGLACDLAAAARLDVAAGRPAPSLPLPGRPARAPLVHPAEVPRRSPAHAQGLAALLHAIAHIVLRDEVGHVATGNHWYRWLCEREGFEPVSHYLELAQRHGAPKLRPPFNGATRRRAGFSQEELAWFGE